MQATCVSQHLVNIPRVSAHVGCPPFLKLLAQAGGCNSLVVVVSLRRRRSVPVWGWNVGCPPRGRAWAARGRSRPRLQAAARQAAAAAAGLGSGHQGGPRGAADAEGRERGGQGRCRATCCRTNRCRRGRRASERGAEPRLHRLLPAAVRHGRRA
eukprot:scaffold50846_cov63-Phaeocystis_antarctica.AAC.3